jgi:DNA primase
LLFDADAAGDLAVDRAVGLFLTKNVEIAIASMPANADPDEFLLENGAEGFERMLAAATDALSYKWKQLARRFNDSGNNLTGQQKAVEEYLKTLADARGSGPVDAIRWGQALSRVSRLTEIPREELNRRFGRATVVSTPARTNHPAIGPARPSAGPGPKRFLSAQDRAERWLLGILLLEPFRWTKVQQSVDVSDFTDPVRRRLAELYWNHQRDEGEPVFNEFLGLLRDGGVAGSAFPDGLNVPTGEDLVALAVETVDEVEALADVSTTLVEALAHFDGMRRKRDEQKLMAELRRTSEEHTNEQAEIDLLKQLQEKARTPDLRRA